MILSQGTSTDRPRRAARATADAREPDVPRAAPFALPRRALAHLTPANARLAPPTPAHPARGAIVARR